MERQWQLLMWDKLESSTVERTPEKVVDNRNLDYLILQIKPHFLYNTLESIRGKATMEGAPEVADMTEALSSFFRYCISRKKNIVTLRDELQNVQEYFRIQRFRFNNRFSLIIDIAQDDQTFECCIPKLTLQPLVENAISHGMEDRRREGQITIRALESLTEMRLYVIDDGKGIDPYKLKQIIDSLHETSEGAISLNEGNTGIALKNINYRIRLLFGEAYGLRLYSTLGLGTTVEIALPRVYQMDDSENIL